MALKILYLQPSVGDLAEIDHPAADMRQALRAVAGGEGIIGSPGPIVTHRAAGANWSVDIAPFQAFVAGDDVADQAYYLITNTATYNLPTPAAPGSGTRTHRVVAQVRDHRHNAGWPAGQYDWAPLCLEDTGSGEPAEPASAYSLADVALAAGNSAVQDSNITNRNLFLPPLATLARGGSTTYSPACYDGVTSVARTVNHASYYRIGRLVVCFFDVTFTNATADGAMVAMPVAGAYRNYAAGTGWIGGAGYPTSQTGALYMYTDCTKFIITGYQNQWLNAPAGGTFRGTGIYEAAAGA